MSLPLLDPDPWLSQVLGKPAFRVSLPAKSELDPIDRSKVRPAKTGDPENAVFLYGKVPTDAVDSCRFLQIQGFRLVDTNVTFVKKFESQPEVQPAGCKIRWAVPGDESPVVTLAQHSFHYSRFHLDPEIPVEKANLIKGEWTGNFFSGKRGKAMVITEVSGKIAGFVLLLEQGNDLIIDLIAVGQSFRHTGVASKMISWVQSQMGPFHNFIVGTQISNTPSIRCYQKLGFTLSASQYVFHYHGPMPEFLKSMSKQHAH